MTRFRLIPRIQRFESAYDEGRLTEARLAEQWPEAFLAIQALEQERWDEAISSALQLFELTRSTQEKAFALQWAVAASELKYDLNRRAELLQLWDRIPDWAADRYCCYLRAYQDGLTHFFAGSLRDAQSRFELAEELCRGIQYSRGWIRAVFHLGLIARDRGDGVLARGRFEDALVVARERGAQRWIVRIEAQLPNEKSLIQNADVSLEAGLFDVEELEGAKHELEILILAREREAARCLLTRMERSRRALGMSKKSASLGAYLPLIQLERGRERLGYLLLEKIRDPILKIRILDLKRRALGSTPAEDGQLLFLREMAGVSSVIIHGASSKDSEKVEISGVPLTAVKDALVRELMLFFLQNQGPADKERIHASIFKGQGYDPVAHDRRIYKLIQRARAAFRRSDLFLNTYGAYEINPVLLGKRHSA